jgi:two-component system, LytTR family, response regulator
MTLTTNSGPTRTVIVEDEPLAREGLARLLRSIPWIDLCGIAHDGESGLALVLRERPVLLLADIQMPGLTGIALVERIPFEVGVIFTTAFDDHAVMAFELGALDYVRKPFGAARLTKALDRARGQLDRISGERAVGQARTSGSAHAPVASAQSPVLSAANAESLGEEMSLATRLHDVTTGSGPLTRLYVRDRGRVLPIRVEDLIRCEAEDDYVALHLEGRRHLLYVRLSGLEKRLDPARFLRIHRSHLIHVDRIVAITPYDASRLAVRMSDGSQVVASRAGTALLRALMR